MYLIVGLGNPGKQYESTRHNIGFMILDLLAQADWEHKYDAEFIKTDDVLLAKPQLFMNLSGKSVAQILKFYPAAKLIVIHDELDFPLGSMKVMKGSGAAGHNGVQSIIDEIGTKDFIRIRIGINNPETRGEIPGDSYVLQKFSDQEMEILKEVQLKAKEAVDQIQTDGLDAAQSKFNG
ncbi:MAG: aminoacyl-tRNA hydrolase [Candidatus Doudnabacteria bacterium]|nr:aminoacyl-tRNA hydrolase [Candidatus Doudnabacteria bacterium]